jgi:hydrogenase maturation protease
MAKREPKERPAKVGRSITIIGVGNPFRGDDGVGLAVARTLRDRAPRGAVVLEQDGEPAGLIAAWEDADAVILVDAVSSGSKPGTIHALDAVKTPLDRDLFRYSIHAFGVAEAVELSRALGSLPRMLWVYGIEGESFEMSEELGADVLAAVPRAVQAVLNQIEEIVSRPSI